MLVNDHENNSITCSISNSFFISFTTSLNYLHFHHHYSSMSKGFKVQCFFELLIVNVKMIKNIIFTTCSTNL